MRARSTRTELEEKFWPGTILEPLSSVPGSSSRSPLADSVETA